MSAPLPSSTTWVDLIPGTSLTQSFMDDIGGSVTAAAASATAASGSAAAASGSAAAASASATAASGSAAAASASATAASGSAAAAAISEVDAAASAAAAAISEADAAASAAAAATSLSNLNASNLTSGTVPDARFPATLPVLSGINLTALNASNLGSGTVPDARFPATLPAASGINLTALNATNLGSGTVPDARFPATLPVASGINLTALNASNLASGTIPNERLPLTLAALGDWGGPNLCLQSQTLDQSPWTLSGVTVTANTTIAPDGTLTADTITRTTAIDNHLAQAIVLPSGASVLAVSCHLKQGTASQNDILFRDLTGGTVFCEVFVTWTAGVPGLSIASGTPTLFPPVALDNGWYRVGFSFSGTFIPGNDNELFVYPAVAAGDSNGGTAIVWGAQVEPNSVLTPYVATTTVIAGGVNLTALNAANLVTGTLPNAVFPATLPAASGINLTALNASNLGSGTVPTARLGTGTASNSTALFGDQTYKPVWVKESITQGAGDLAATSNSVTPQTITAFPLPTTSSAAYQIRGVIFFSCLSGQGIQFQLIWGGINSYQLRTNVRTDVSLLTDETFVSSSGSPVVILAVTSTVTKGFIEFDMVVRVSTGTGNGFQFAQNALGAGTQTKILIGSYIEYTVIT